MPDSPYFDGCYFDETYFDAAPCVIPPTPTGGRSGRLARRRIDFVARPEPTKPDDEEAILVLEGF